MSSSASALTHLGVLVLEPETGTPIARLPLYAEIALPAPEAAATPDPRFDDPGSDALQQALPACFDSATCRQRTLAALATAIPETLPAGARDALANDPQAATAFLADALRRAAEAASPADLTDLTDAELARVIAEALAGEAENAGLVTPGADTSPVIWAHPLGVMATDHAGYASFDLSRLPNGTQEALVKAVETRRQDVDAVREVKALVYPTARDGTRFDALAQGRFGDSSVLLKLELSRPEVAGLLRELALPSMQSPSLIDWRLSPASFAASPAALVGGDGCETLFPANLAIQEFHFHQVVRLRDVDAPNVPAAMRDQIKLGVVHDYRLGWYPLGHSLGQIQYSLALAPGESVNLAVIDWTRRDEATRAEDTTLNERLVHNQRRDRTITETVKAALSEHQEGSSFMAGVALSGGVGAALGGSAGLAAGLAGALGGGSSDSSGSRDLAAETVQQLSENIAQASSAMRELQSTVVVRSAQSEHETIETRTVVNYNHSHALTVLYYEVLRHFRVVTELNRRRPAVLVKMKADWFEGADADVEKTILQNRRALEDELLDARLAAAFDALERKVHRAGLPAAPPPGEPSFDLRYFTFRMKTGGRCADPNEDEDVNIEATLFGAPSVKLVNQAAQGGPAPILDPPGAFTEKDTVWTFTAMPQGAPVAWKSVDGIGIGIGLKDDTTVSFARITIEAIDTHGQPHTILDRDYQDGHLAILEDTEITLPLLRPPAPPAPPPRPAEEIEDELKSKDLLAHVKHHKAHYSRAILLHQDPAERARTLDGIPLPDGTTALDHVENRPLEVLGDYVAYPAADPDWHKAITEALARTELPDVPPDERLLTLPTRGVFAEAKLGHCNASEEIDNTRFWDWQQSPIPHLAPEIAPVQAVTPEAQTPDLSPTPFPQPVVNIVNPPAAPDPTGLAAALSAIATPNIFRDMSTSAQVGDLLRRLSDNSIRIAEAASRARQILGQQAGAAGGGGSGSAAADGRTPAAGAGAGAGAGGRMTPNEQWDHMQVNRAAERHGDITPEKRQELNEKIAENPVRAGDPVISLLDTGPMLRSFGSKTDKGGAITLYARTQASVQKVRWALEEGPASVDITDRPGPSAEVASGWPGLCAVKGEALDAGGAVLGKVSTTLSVPLFVRVLRDTTEWDAQLASWQLTDRSQEILEACVKRAETLLQRANVRFVWRESLPKQFLSPGPSFDALYQMNLGDDAAAAGVVTRGAKRSATLNLGKITAVPEAGPPLEALIESVAEPGIDEATRSPRANVAAGHIGGLLGWFLAAEVSETALGVAVPPLTSTEQLGYRVKAGASPGDWQSYESVEGGVRFPHEVEAQYDVKFPVPPAFS